MGRRWDGLRGAVTWTADTGSQKRARALNEFAFFRCVCYFIAVSKDQPSSAKHHGSIIKEEGPGGEIGNGSICGMQDTLLAPQRSFKLSLVNHTSKTERRVTLKVQAHQGQRLTLTRCRTVL